MHGPRTVYLPIAYRDQKRALDPLELQLQTIVSHPMGVEYQTCVL